MKSPSQSANGGLLDSNSTVMAYIENLIRIANTDIDGSKGLAVALTNISGVGYNFSHAVCNVLQLDLNQKAGDLKPETIKRVEDVLQNPVKFNIPDWMLNRVNDPETGETKHLTQADVRFVREEDIKTMKKIKSYRGLRHQWGLPVRGQRTKSNFRKGKGKATGVKKKR